MVGVAQDTTALFEVGAATPHRRPRPGLSVSIPTVVPVWPNNREWGYYRAATLSFLLLVWIGLIWFGFVALWWPQAA